MQKSIKKITKIKKISLSQKVDFTVELLEKFYTAKKGQIYISFSGGKDSTVLLYLARLLFPNVVATFFNTGLEFPEIISFVNQKNNINIIHPKNNFKFIIEKYGIPYPTKMVAHTIDQIRNTKSDKLRDKLLNGCEKGNFRKLAKKWRHLLDYDIKFSAKCCTFLKVYPATKYKRETGLSPVLGVTSGESYLRDFYNNKQKNCFINENTIKLEPLKHWTQADILLFIKKRKIDISEIYSKGYKRTGCMFCLFGIKQETQGNNKKNRLQLLRETHPKQHNYIINKLNFKNLLDKENIKY